MTRLEQAAALRADTQRHWNCCQSVIAPFADRCGITQEQAFQLGANFGAGMKIGSTCGAVTGGLMVLGMAGAGDEAARRFLQHFRAAHQATNCPDLLRIDREKGNTNKQAHCDGLVYECVELVETLLAGNG